ncbi:PhoH family protein [Rothia sp. AR01]|uniref:PhoH-like protein n=1 Tax=Rothia santali TaxID=2949643 RepID=A0A9X2H7S1_9MICC|nr:PhoH family protein [Rothia santali]MCP3424619.1 PhoH family protein [Rothia santali]
MSSTPAGVTRPLSVSRTFDFASRDSMVQSLGPQDSSVLVIEQAFPGISLRVRELEISVTGPSAQVDVVIRLLEELEALARQETVITAQVVKRIVDLLIRNMSTATPTMTQNILSSRGRKIRPKTVNQSSYVDAIDAHTVTFGIGPAGTGKTYLAMAKAVQALQAKEVNRIILTRPAVEAGERLGFLPGSLNEKIDPYLRPLFDALHDMMEPESIPRLMEAGTIEVAPLAYMRGRTLNDAFIVLDEAQNTTIEQMKMFLTRLGFGSKMVITGDVTQVDLPNGAASGLRQVRRILDGVEDIHFTELEAVDVVRHQLVSDIVTAYSRWEEAEQAGGPSRRRRGPRGTGPAASEGRGPGASQDAEAGA